jgi:hypothetical protein
MAKADDTGNGAQAAVATGALVTEGRSTPSRAAKRARRNTGNDITVAERLEILQQALVDLERHGISVTAIRHPERRMAILALSGADYCQYCRRLRLREEMDGDKCQYCAGK